MFKNAQSLNTKVIGIAVTVGVIVALVVGLMMYLSSVKPVQSTVEAAMLEEMQVHINAAIELKVQSGIMGATAMTLQRNVMEALVVEDRDEVLDLFGGIREGFRSKSNFNNIATILLTADGRMLVRSWDLDNYGQSAANSPLIQRAMSEKQAFAALGVGARGVGVMAISPVVDEGEFLGMISLLQDLASVVYDFKHNLNIDWVLLTDKRYLNEKYPGMGIVEENTAIGENYVLANNRWFDEATVKLFTRSYTEQADDQLAVYVRDGKVVIDIPAYDEENNVLGRHLFIMDEQRYLAPIQMAMNNAWLSLASVLVGIFLLTFALVLAIGRMVIKPLQRVQLLSEQIIKTGDFSLRASISSNDEVGKTSLAINQLLENVSEALTGANKTVSAIAEGDFNQRIEGQYVGDLQTLQQGVNASADNIAKVMTQFGRTMEAMKRGEFKLKLECEAKGEYLKMMNNAQATMDEMSEIIAEINSVMQAMAQGEFNHRVQTQAKGEMKLLKDSINESMEQLDEAIKEITRIVVAQSEGDLTQLINGDYEGDLLRLKNAVNSSLTKLAQIVSQAVQAADIVNNAAKEVSQGSLDLSERVQQQAAALEQTSATMDQMNSAVQNNTDNAQNAAKVAGSVQAEAQQGEKVMKQTIAAMGAIQESSHKISEIVSLIDGIAFQTNLLALNAAVEAARAGEHGRGFAVVAGEVRALAQKSAEAAKDIKKLINESVGRIDEGTKLASASGERLDAITHSIEEVSAMINQIAQASAEQADGVSQVHSAISDIDCATQQNAALVEQTSATSESMSEQANELSRNMGFFKTSSSASPAKIAAKAAPKLTKNTVKSIKPMPQIKEAKSNSDEWQEF
ncbi:methyl-accepting chemotaxis protein [Thiomicrospira sp. R3]|uniref:methyl-accepting chemotaxis protein n=1 Tax=Thiomicrospira sp. R3 TaxID=3035472 RepID=UPI00259B633C|nr:methyl-accepting chemotaxis protein [Thiomicrospira sp. R3]WFE67839.1 methyl-accepting chemotaxis protein [Thiomicrospira sp. R3]